MKTIKNQLLGTLQYDEFFWERKYAFVYEGKTNLVDILIYGEENQTFDEYHYASFTWLNSTFEQSLNESKTALKKYIATNYNTDECKLTLSAIIIPYKENNANSCVGLLFDSPVDEEHGFAAKFLNGRLYSVGSQDIII